MRYRLLPPLLALLVFLVVLTGNQSPATASEHTIFLVPGHEAWDKGEEGATPRAILTKALVAAFEKVGPQQTFTLLVLDTDVGGIRAVAEEVPLDALLLMEQAGKFPAKGTGDGLAALRAWAGQYSASTDPPPPVYFLQPASLAHPTSEMLSAFPEALKEYFWPFVVGAVPDREKVRADIERVLYTWAGVAGTGEELAAQLELARKLVSFGGKLHTKVRDYRGEPVSMPVGLEFKGGFTEIMDYEPRGFTGLSRILLPGLYDVTLQTPAPVTVRRLVPGRETATVDFDTLGRARLEAGEDFASRVNLCDAEGKPLAVLEDLSRPLDLPAGTYLLTWETPGSRKFTVESGLETVVALP
jgi:hypothetical protein